MSDETTTTLIPLVDEQRTIALPDVPRKWASPPKEMLSVLDRGKGVKLDYLGHADTTLALIDVDPWFTFDYHRDERGRMDVYEMGTNWVLEGTLTVHGVTRPCVGTCEKRKQEVHKELLGDLLRNGAMRFGIATGLWSKLDDVTDAHYAQPAEPAVLSAENLDRFDKACHDKGLDPALVMAEAFPSGIPDPLLDTHLPVMRATFKKLVAEQAPAEPEIDSEGEPMPADVGPVDEPEQLLASDAQVKKIQVLMGKLGIKDRVARLSHIMDVLELDERPASTKTLTADQAHILIERMEAVE